MKRGLKPTSEAVGVDQENSCDVIAFIDAVKQDAVKNDTRTLQRFQRDAAPTLEGSRTFRTLHLMSIRVDARPFLGVVLKIEGARAT